MNIVVGNGTSPTSGGTTASLSGTSQTSLNSETANGGSSPPPTRLRNKNKKEDVKESGNNGVMEAAPIATVEEACDDLKLDGGEAGVKSASPPSCTRLDEASQACV